MPSESRLKFVFERGFKVLSTERAYPRRASLMIDGVKMWTSPEPSLALAVVSFQPGSLDTRKLSTALYQKDRIGCATRGGQDRPGLRFSPHFYNTHADIERTLAAVKKYMATGV